MNILKTMISRMVITSLLLFGVNAYAFQHLEDAFETESLRITLKEGEAGVVTGSVQVKMCKQCKKKMIPVSVDTKAFERGVQVPLMQAKDRLGRYATIFVDLQHTKVTRITW